MTGQEAVDLIHQEAWTGRKPGLSRTFELLGRLGNPHEKLKFVHITGTNGKGSTAAMVAQALTSGGYRVGLYTSPHLWTFHERFQVDGQPISDPDLGRVAEQVILAGRGMEDPATEFELMTALGMVYFLEQKCDIVVLEVGLGGRLDSTNVIPAPEVAVITNLGLEHTAELGDTLTLIAQEKAGIIKPGCRAVLYKQTDEVEGVVSTVCRQTGVELTLTAPETVAGLTARLAGEESQLEFDGLSVETGPLDGDGLTPVSAVPALLEAARSGYITACGLEGEGTVLRVDCGDPTGSPGAGTEYALWFDASAHTLIKGEISVDGFRVILCEFSQFTM